MERCKVIFNDKTAKRQIAMLLLLLLGLILFGQIAVAQMAENYKRSMLEHDYSVAGYLSRQGFEDSLIISAFSGDNGVAFAQEGAALLSSYGYNENMQNSLLPEVERFRQKFSITVLAFSTLFAVAALAICCYSLLRKDKQITIADAKLTCFLDGETGLRLDDGEEGSLSRLFTRVNAMATSLTAHIEKEKQSRGFLKDTISDISHQLRTPLAALRMYNEIIIDEKTGNETVESFTFKSQRELNRMENLIQSLLKIARFDAGAIKLEKKSSNLRNFLENVIDGFLTRAEIENKKISFECDASVMLCVDETWLGEAVGNIIKNALDHTYDNNQIEISCLDTAVVTEIIIRDNGAGIHQEDIHFIFKRFYRSRFSKDKQGAGIGLALSKVIIEKHGGTITVQSELGKGAEFHLLFPKLANL